MTMDNADLLKLVAIDPPGCGCTECLIGEYIPFDSFHISQVLDAVFAGVITVRNNLNDGTLILYRRRGELRSAISNQLVSRGDIVVIPPNDVFIDDDSSNSEEGVIDILPLLDKNYFDTADPALVARIVEGATVANSTTSTFIAYRSPYGDTDIIQLEADEGKVVILYND